MAAESDLGDWFSKSGWHPGLCCVYLRGGASIVLDSSATSSNHTVAYRNKNRPKSWSLPVSDGDLSEIVCWRGASHWLEAIELELISSSGLAARTVTAGRSGRRTASIDSVMRYARVVSSYADRGTGRGVAVSNDTAAREAHLGVSTVRRSRAILEKLGYVQTVRTGRYLSREEQKNAREAHGGTQRKAASVRVLTLPKSALLETSSVDGEHLSSSSPEGRELLTVNSSHQTRYARRQRKNIQPKPCSRPRALPTQRLAAALMARIPWLRGVQHPGSVARIIELLAIDAKLWDVDDLLEIDERLNAIAGRSAVEHSAVRNPLGLLRKFLSDVLSYAQAHNHVPKSRRREQIAKVRQERLEQQKTRQLEEDKRRAALDHDEIDRIIASMRSAYPRHA